MTSPTTTADDGGPQPDTTGTEPAPDTGDGTDDTDWKALAEKAKDDADKWKSLARRHEDRAKANADAATKAQTVEEQLEQLRKDMALRDLADVTRSGRLAVSQVHARLAEAGLSRQDVDGLLDLVDPTTLLTDGEPDDKAIGRLVKSLTRVAGRTTPDRDQGRTGGTPPSDMNTMIRRAAGVIP